MAMDKDNWQARIHVANTPSEISLLCCCNHDTMFTFIYFSAYYFLFLTKIYDQTITSRTLGLMIIILMICTTQ